MKIVLLDCETLGKDIDLKRFAKFGEVTYYNTTKPEETLSRVKEADIIITNKVVITEEHMRASNIKLICVAATGTNNVDHDCAKELNIPVKNVAGYSSASVAQVTFALVLELIQKTSYYTNYVESGGWEKSKIFTHLDQPFHELEGKNWGIIGLGNIGQTVAKIATGFGCNVNYYSTSGTNNNTTYNQQTLEELLSQNDVISIHSPLNEKTENLIKTKELKLLKEKAILINVGRGGIINEEDLAKVLDKKEIYCGLDVVAKEPIDKYNPLRAVEKKERIIITPHIAWASIEARERLMQGVEKNIADFLKG